MRRVYDSIKVFFVTILVSYLGEHSYLCSCTASSVSLMTKVSTAHLPCLKYVGQVCEGKTGEKV